jgi:hypothetical protein
VAVTFERARELVERTLRALRPADAGTLYVAPDGSEDNEAWQVVAGPREALVEDDAAHLLAEWPALLVNKRTGELVEFAVVEHLERLGPMRSVRGSRRSEAAPDDAG